MSEHIPVFRPAVSSEAVWKRLRPSIESGWLGQGKLVEELEAKLAVLVGAKHFVCTGSCTAALHLAVHCLDLPEGSRVLTSPITFVATNAVLLWERLRPVFGKVTPFGMLTGCHNGVEATIIVHLGGAECKLPQQGGPIIEDCAHAFGAPWATKQGENTRCWSFHAVKNLPMGDGGGLSTNDDKLAERYRRLRWFGIDKSTDARSRNGYSTDYQIEELGWKYQMNDVTAALGLAALETFADAQLERYLIASAYHRHFPENSPDYAPEDSACHFYPLFFDNREAVEKSLAADNIAFTRHYKPNFDFRPFWPFWGHSDCDDTYSAREYYHRALVLPMFPGMTAYEQNRVITAVRYLSLRRSKRV